MRHLVAALKDEASEVRAASAEALGNIGPGAKSALPALEAATADPDKNVAAAARVSLGRISD